jgi:hypothetical protein
MADRLKKAAEIATGIIGLAMISVIVTSRNNSARIIAEVAQAQARMIKIAMGERIVESRNVPRFEELLGAIDDPTMTELFAGLSDTDLDWIENMLKETSE